MSSEAELCTSTKDFSSQLKSGEKFRGVTPTVTVVWLVEPLFPELTQLHSIFELRERSTGLLFTEDIRIHLLQLSALGRDSPSSADASTSQHSSFEEAVRRWARFLSISSQEDLNALAKEDPVMADAAKSLQDLSEDPEAKRLADQRADLDLFYDLSISNAEARGEGRALRHQIERYCAEFKIELSDKRRSLLEQEGTDLGAILNSIVLHHRWPEA